MPDNFPHFAKLTMDQYQAITKAANTFVTSVDGDTLWLKYLESFPDGTNPIFKKRTEHDCSCCKSVTRRIGNVISIKEDGSWSTAQVRLEIIDSYLADDWPQFVEALVYDRVDHRLIDRCMWFENQIGTAPEDVTPNAKLYLLKSVWT